MDKCREEFLKQHSSKVLKIVKFDESKNGFVLHDHLELTTINFSALAELNYGWGLWQHQQEKVDTLTQKLSVSLGDIDVANKNLRDRFSAFQIVRKEADDLQKRVDAALEDMELESLKLKEGYDGYKDPVGICQSEGIEIARKILEQALKGGEE